MKGYAVVWTLLLAGCVPQKTAELPAAPGVETDTVRDSDATSGIDVWMADGTWEGTHTWVAESAEFSLICECSAPLTLVFADGEIVESAANTCELSTFTVPCMLSITPVFTGSVDPAGVAAGTVVDEDFSVSTLWTGNFTDSDGQATTSTEEVTTESGLVTLSGEFTLSLTEL